VPTYSLTLPDGSTHQVNVDAGATPEDFDHIEQQLAGPRAGGAAPVYVPELAAAPATDPYASSSPAEAASTPEMASATPPWTPRPKAPPLWPKIPISDQPADASGWGAAGGYLLRQAERSINAMGQAATDVAELTAGDPSYANLSTLGDVAGAAYLPLAVNPATAPITLGAAAAGATGRYFGATEPQAQMMEAAVNAAGGAANVARGIYNATAGGQLKGLIRRFGTSEPSVAGQALQEELPDVLAAKKDAIAAPTYEAAKDYVRDNGITITPEDHEALVQKAQNALDTFGKMPGGMKPSERTVAEQLVGATKPTTPAGPLLHDASGNPIGGAPGAPAARTPPTYDELDAMYRNLAPIGRPSAVREAVDTVMNNMITGTPAEDLRAAGKVAWAKEVTPLQAITGAVRKTTRGVPNPLGAFKVGGGEQWVNPESLKVIKANVSPEVWAEQRGAFFHNLFDKANRDPERAVTLWGKVKPDVRALVDPNGYFDAGMRGLNRATKGGALVGNIVRGAGASMGITRLLEGHIEQGLGLLFGMHELPIGGLATGAVAATLGGALPAVGGALRTVPTLALMQQTKMPPPEHPSTPAAESETPTESPATPSEEPTPPPVPPAAAAPPSPRPPSRTASLPFDREIQAVAQVTGVPPELLHAVMQQESSYNPRAVGPPNHTGELARGPMQILPSQFEKYRGRVEQLNGRKGDVTDPLDNIVAGALHLRDDLDASQGDLAGTLGRYYGARDPRYIGSVALKLRRLGIDVRLPGSQQPTAVARRPAMPPGIVAQLGNIPGLGAGYGG
jgi:SLT domain-containing protein